MFSQADASKYALPGKPNRKATAVDYADEVVDIRDILLEMGVWTPTGDYFSYKIYCPWHAEHSDQHDKNCRIFPPTNVYCWAMHGYITPSLLYSRWKSLPREKAAEELLDQRGLLYKPWRERWNDVIDLREDKQHRKLGSKDDFISALNIALHLVPEYVDNEYHTSVRLKWRKILGLIDNLWTNKDVSLEQLQEFFDASLTTLTAVATLVDDSEE